MTRRRSGKPSHNLWPIIRLVPLEPRILLSQDGENDLPHGAGLPCACPACSPRVDAADVISTEPSAAAVPVTGGVPAMSSRPSATAKIYLDFNGDIARQWGSYSVPATPAYDTDGDASTFGDPEIALIQEIWARVAEKFSPFNIDVTTVDPGTLANKVAMQVVIGGNGSWYGAGYGGTGYVGGFYNSASNVVYAFEDNLGNGNPFYVAEAAAHEAGHNFGLNHISEYSGTTKVREYYRGDAFIAPVMGSSYYAPRGVWWHGANSSGSTVIQDDLAIISNTNNGFGYRADDHGGTNGTATALTASGGSLAGAGVIERSTDVDFFSFTTGGGQVSFTASIPTGGMLDLTLSLRNAAGNVITLADTASLGESLTASLAAGTYYVVVASKGAYGDLGQYTLGGTVTGATPGPAADAGGPYTVGEGGSVMLGGSASTGAGLSYAWDLDNDGVFGETGAGATRGNETGVAPTFLAAGLDGASAYTVSLRVTDSNNVTSTDTATIDVTNVAPTPTAANVSSSVQLGATHRVNLVAADPGTADAVTWVINWGDGTTSTATGRSTYAEHVYATAGSFAITATAADNDGGTADSTTSVTVLAPTLAASVTGPATGVEGSSVTLQFSASGTDTVTEWLVNWGDGSATQSFAAGATSAAHVYRNQGSFAATVVAVGQSSSDDASHTVAVGNAAPIVSLSGDGSSSEGSLYQLTLDATDAGVDDAISWTILWGDGSSSTVTGRTPTVSHAYADDGKYTVTATANDGVASTSQTHAVAVANVAPAATVTASGATVLQGATYTLDLSATDPGSADAVSWSIDWGDGTTGTATGRTGSVGHAFAAAGAKTVTVTATDDDGATHVRTVSATVQARTLDATVNAPAWADEGSTHQVTFSAAGTDTVSGWTVNWGDGTTSTLAAGTTSAGHAYANEGAFTVTVTATGTYTSDAATAAVTVLNVAPTATASGNATATEGSPYTLDLSAADPGALDAIAWTIDWGDGTTTAATGRAAVATHVYGDNGVYTVKATARDDGNLSAGAGGRTVTVDNAPQKLAATGPSSIVAWARYTLALSAQDVGSDTVSSWTIDWGDGNVEVVTGNPSAVTHAYVGAGSFTIAASAADEDGTFTAAPVAVDVVAAPIDTTAPTAQLIAKTTPAAHAKGYQFTVRYSDAGGVDVASLGGDEVLVTGPNGFRQFATLVSTTVSADGTVVNAAYAVTAPGDAWDFRDAGNYAVRVVGAHVADRSANLLPTTSLGTFNCPSYKPGTPERKVAIAAGGLTSKYAGTLGKANYVDTFALDLTATTRIVASVSAGLGGVVFDLVRPDGTVVLRKVNRIDRELKAGNYVIRVYTMLTASRAYVLQVRNYPFGSLFSSTSIR